MSDAPAEPAHIAAEPSAGDVSPSDPASNAVQVPETLRVWAGMTWRVLVILAGFGVLFLIMGQIAVVLVALFLAAFFTALASPIMSFLQRRAHLHRAIAMVLAIIIIGVAVVVVLWIVINSIINEAPALSKSIQQSFSQIQTWASGPPLNLSDDDFSGYVTEVEN